MIKWLISHKVTPTYILLISGREFGSWRSLQCKHIVLVASATCIHSLLSTTLGNSCICNPLAPSWPALHSHTHSSCSCPHKLHWYAWSLPTDGGGETYLCNFIYHRENLNHKCQITGGNRDNTKAVVEFEVVYMNIKDFLVGFQEYFESYLKHLLPIIWTCTLGNNKAWLNSPDFTIVHRSMFPNYVWSDLKKKILKLCASSYSKTSQQLRESELFIRSYKRHHTVHRSCSCAFH